jgi:Cdc6-like AAA superfamily ATPase
MGLDVTPESDEKPLWLTLRSDWDYPPHFRKEQGHFVGRRREVDRLLDSLLRKDSGSILVSGNRGVGKTALVFKAMQELQKLRPKAIPVVLNVSQLDMDLGKTAPDCPSLKLREDVVKNLIRRLYAAVASDGKLAHILAESGLDVLYKKASAAETVKQEKIGVEAFEQESVEQQTTRQIAFRTPDKALAIVASSLLSLFLAFNPVLPEVGVLQAVNRTLPVAIALLGAFTMLYSWRRVEEHQAIRKRALKASEYYAFDASLGNLQADLERTLDELVRLQHKIVFCVDELDKMENPRLVVETIRSFKNLFTLSSAVFVLITGKEIFDEFEKSKPERTIDYTLFTHRIFIPRPTFEDLESFIGDIVEEPKRDALEHDERYNDFRNQLCFLAKSDFFDLYDVIRDHIRDFDSSHRPRVLVPTANVADDVSCRLQKAMGQIYGLHEQTMVSRWSHNELLLADLYAFIDQLIRLPPNTAVQDPADAKDPDFFAARKDLCVYLARLAAMTSTKSPQGVITFVWTGSVPPVPSMPKHLLEHEEKFVGCFDRFRDEVLAYTNAYLATLRQTEVTLQTLERAPTEVLKTALAAVEADFKSVMDQCTNFYLGLRKTLPNHYRVEELQNLYNMVEGQRKLLVDRSMVLVRNAMKELFKDAQVGVFQQNEKLFPTMQDLRSAIIKTGTEHSVVHRADLTRQILLTHNAAPEAIASNAELLRESRRSLFILNVQTKADLPYVRTKSFKNLDLLTGLGQIPQTVNSLRKWYER